MLRVVQGQVVKKSSDKTIKVRVDKKSKHPVVGKYILRSTYFLVHDAKNACQVGDKVGIAEGVKVSKNKTWHLVEVNGKKSEVKS